MSEHIGFALQTAGKDCSTYLRTLSLVYDATKRMLETMDWVSMYPKDPEGRKQELLETTFMGRLGSYLLMEEEWIFGTFRGRIMSISRTVRN